MNLSAKPMPPGAMGKGKAYKLGRITTVQSSHTVTISAVGEPLLLSRKAQGSPEDLLHVTEPLQSKQVITKQVPIEKPGLAKGQPVHDR